MDTLCGQQISKAHEILKNIIYSINTNFRDNYDAAGTGKLSKKKLAEALKMFNENMTSEVTDALVILNN